MSSTVRSAVPRLNVYVQTAETVRAMIPMITSCPLRYHQSSAYLTGKALITGVCLIITFFVLFSLILSIQFSVLQYRIYLLSVTLILWEAVPVFTV